jgi:hypothetical protein
VDETKEANEGIIVANEFVVEEEIRSVIKRNTGAHLLERMVVEKAYLVGSKEIIRHNKSSGKLVILPLAEFFITKRL